MGRMKNTGEKDSIPATLTSLKIFLFVVVFIATSCGQEPEVKFERDSTGQQIPIGFTPRSILSDTLHSYHRWFDRGYARYVPDTALVEPLRGALTDGVEILVFYGTWCSDTRRELPRLMKILDTVGFPEENVKYCGVNRAKRSGDDFAKKHDVRRVATFIIYKDGEELGRIIESPTKSLESDLLHILIREYPSRFGASNDDYRSRVRS